MEKNLFEISKNHPGSWNRILRSGGPILALISSAVFIFALGFHLGESVALYNIESARAGLYPAASNVTYLTNTTDVALNITAADTVSIQGSSPVLDTVPVYDDDEEEEEEEEERALITYVYYETPNSRENALFFIKHGFHAEADFIFIINGETTLTSHIPIAPNVQIIHRNNTCFDLGTHAEILTANNGTLIKKYNRFIMLNGSIRGPFLPTWSKECWSDAYLDKITETNKLVGMTMRCNADGGKRKVMQSMIFATDRIGLQVLLPVLNHCFEDFWKAVGAEEHAAQTMLDAGYNITALMSSFQSSPDYAHTCTHGEVLGNDWYFGTNLHPYETIFQKANRNIFPRQLELLTAWHDQSGYSSWEVCREKRIRMRRRFARRLT
ncbi:hypothetical protein TWF730_001831 [Orbilia blumenaviensis]